MSNVLHEISNVLYKLKKKIFNHLEKLTRVGETDFARLKRKVKISITFKQTINFINRSTKTGKHFWQRKMKCLIRPQSRYKRDDIYSSNLFQMYKTYSSLC